MPLMVEQVLALAPDESAAKAGRGLAATKHWRELGQSAEAMWGLCQGSALYQVQVELTTLAYKCSCPSHKLPCKHVLGLLLLAAADAAVMPQGAPPEWAHEWLQKRAAAAQRQTHATWQEAPPDPAAQSKRAERRTAQVTAGIAGLNLWLEDVVRNGLAQVETQPGSFWEGQAARLMDAQAPGLASRVRRLATIPNSGPNWPERLLDEMGRLALLTHAFGRMDELEPALREDVRQLVGWSLSQEEVVARGETVADDWLIVGQWLEDEDPRMRTQRTWLLGERTGRHALVLQFSPRPLLPPFPEPILPGVRFTGKLAFWPSAYPQRARITARQTAPAPLGGRLPGAETLAAALAGVTHALARQPWMDRFLIALRDVRVARDESGGWRAQDAAGAALSLAGGEHWLLLAVSGGAPCWLAGEWDGHALRPLGVEMGGRYHAL